MVFDTFAGLSVPGREISICTVTVQTERDFLIFILRFLTGVETKGVIYRAYPSLLYSF
jgi:hypothetical protein